MGGRGSSQGDATRRGDSSPPGREEDIGVTGLDYHTQRSDKIDSTTTYKEISASRQLTQKIKPLTLLQSGLDHNPKVIYSSVVFDEVED
ncbi:hypothetical protein STEG23_031738 [Scotinomys teguina]